MINALLVTLIALVLAYVLSEVMRHLRLPGVVGQISAGIILGIPFIREYILNEEVISIFNYIANIGIILMFFFVGLEISFAAFRRNLKESVYVSFFNTIIPLAIGFVVMKYLFSFDTLTSLIIGIALAVSAQAISLDILQEMKLIKSRVGTIIMESGTVDDVFELLLISVLLIAFHATTFQGLNLINLLIDIVIFAVIVIVFKSILIPYTLKMCEADKSRSNLFMGALMVVLLMAYLSEVFGIGSLIGALVAGILMRQTFLSSQDRKPWRKTELSHSVHAISFGFLIPLFFVNVGLQADLSALSSNLWLVLVLILIDLLGTVFGSVIGVLLSGGTLREGFIVGWGVSPKGDTELVIASLALNKGLISVDIYTAIITVALITTFVAPIVFKFLVKRHAPGEKK